MNTWGFIMKKYVNMKFNAILENVTFARGTVASFLIDEELTINELNEIKTIVSEGITNAIVHGYLEDKTKEVEFIMELENDKLTITIKDKGVGIEDVRKAREPLFSTKLETERAGLGFTIMEIFSDELEVISKLNEGTTVIAKKILK